MSRLLPALALLLPVMTACTMEEEVRQRCAGTADRAACIATEPQRQVERQRDLEREMDRQRRARP